MRKSCSVCSLPEFREGKNNCFIDCGKSCKAGLRPEQFNPSHPRWADGSHALRNELLIVFISESEANILKSSRGAPLRGNILAPAYFKMYPSKFLISGCPSKDGPTPREGTLRRKEMYSGYFQEIRGMVNLLKSGSNMFMISSNLAPERLKSKK